MACRDCLFLNVPLNKAGKRVADNRHGYRCTVPLPTLDALLPKCVEPPRLYPHCMSPDDGEGCAFWAKYVKEDK